MAPDTMVAVAPANASWKMTDENSPSKPERNNVGAPTIPITSHPYARLYPTATYTIHANTKSNVFFMTMLPAFFALVNPDSTIAKPACMKNTSAAATISHMASTADTRSTSSYAI